MATEGLQWNWTSSEACAAVCLMGLRSWKKSSRVGAALTSGVIGVKTVRKRSRCVKSEEGKGSRMPWWSEERCNLGLPSWKKFTRKRISAARTNKGESTEKTLLKRATHIMREKGRSSGVPRWPEKRYSEAQRRLVETMQKMGADRGRLVMRVPLRDEARKQIRDTGLLDHLLKHSEDKILSNGTETFTFKRWHSAKQLLHYWLEPAGVETEGLKVAGEDLQWNWTSSEVQAAVCIMGLQSWKKTSWKRVCACTKEGVMSENTPWKRARCDNREEETENMVPRYSKERDNVVQRILVETMQKMGAERDRPLMQVPLDHLLKHSRDKILSNGMETFMFKWACFDKQLLQYWLEHNDMNLEGLKDYQDQGVKVEFSEPISELHKVDEFLEKQESHMHQAVRRSWFQRVAG